MTSIHRLMTVVVEKSEAVTFSTGKMAFDICGQLPLIALQRKDILAFLLLDLRGYLLLTAHGVDGDKHAFELQAPQNLGNRGNLIRLVVHLPLRQYQTAFMRVGAQDMDCFLSTRHMPGAANRFPINATVPDIHVFHEPLHPPGVCRLQLLRVENGENPAESIVRRNAIGQFKKRPEPVYLALAEGGDLRPMLRAANNGADGNNQNVE